MAAPSIATRTARTQTQAKTTWLEERRGYLGATDISAIMEVNPYSTPHDVWLDKKGLKEDKSTIPMRAGTYMETFIAAEFQRMSKAKILRSKTYRHPKFPFLACNPDREFTYKGNGIEVDAILECKNVGHWAARNFGHDGSDQVPEQYLMQVLWQLIITRKDLVVLAALIDDREIRTFYYSLNPEYSTFAHIFPQEMAKKVFNYAIWWWENHIERDIEPQITGRDSDTEFLKGSRATYENGQLINTDPATDKECAALERSIKRLDKAALVVNERKNRIKAFMAKNNASALESTVGIFTWKTDARGVASLRTPFKSGRA